MFTVKKPFNDFVKLIHNYEAVDLATLGSIFTIFGHKLYLVGGCMRDMLLNRTPKDIDLCTDATPDQMREILQRTEFKTWASGEKHGTLTITSKNGSSFECTTFRDESTVNYEDHRHIKEVKFSKSIEEDLQRRDFTINSFAYDLQTAELVMLDKSYLQDLELGIIRCVGRASDRFNEDALRMLRAIRFAAQLGFTIEDYTFKAIKDKAATLSYVSIERCRDELIKILMSDHPEMLDLLRTTRLARYFNIYNLDLDALVNEDQHNKYHYTDVWHHTIDVIKSCPKDLTIRLAALFHDFGKTSTCVVDEKGQKHFPDHPAKSASSFKYSFGVNLKLTNNQIEDVYKLIKYHDVKFIDQDRVVIKRIIADLGVELFKKLLRLRWADAVSHMLYSDDDCYINSLSNAKQVLESVILNKEPLYISDLAVNGNDLLELGYKGPEIGQALNKMLEAVLIDPSINRKDILLSRIKKSE